MEFRYLLPYAEEMTRHKAQEILRSVSSGRLAQSNGKSMEVQDIMRGLEDTAYGGQQWDDGLQDDQPMTIEQVRATMSLIGMDFEVVG